jgi:hypothetical protein
LAFLRQARRRIGNADGQKNIAAAVAQQISARGL